MRPARLLTLTLILLLAAPLPAQSPSGEQGAEPTPKSEASPVPKARITGSVLCSDTRQPARGAKLMLMAMPATDKSQNPVHGARQIMGIVGVDGTFALERVPPGEYVLLGFLPGYTSAFDGFSISDAESEGAEAAFMKKLAERGVLHVGPDGTIRADLLLERGAAVSGRVVYADGAPATEVSIELEDTTIAPAPGDAKGRFANVGAMMRMFLNHQSAGTDDLGRFRIAGIASATYRVAAIEPASAPGTGTDEMSMMIGVITDPHAARVYAGDTLHRKAAKTYELHPGDDLTGIEIRLPIDGFHTVNGTVSATDGRPVTMGQLILTDTADDALSFTAETRDDGTFAIPHVPPGTYTLASRDARLTVPPPDPDSAAANEPTFFQPTHAFADASTTVIVKEADVTGADLHLTEIPVPAETAPSAPSEPGAIQGNKMPVQVN